MPEYHVMSLRMDERLGDEVKLVAGVLGVSVNEFARRALVAHLAEIRSQPDFAARLEAKRQREAEVLGIE